MSHLLIHDLLSDLSRIQDPRFSAKSRTVPANADYRQRARRARHYAPERLLPLRVHAPRLPEPRAVWEWQSNPGSGPRESAFSIDSKMLMMTGRESRAA